MNSDPTPASTNWAADLRDLVNRAFDTNEMHELAFDFNLDYDDLPGRGKAGKIVELLQILARQQRIPEFIERCQTLRPRENWQPLLEAARSEPLSFHVDYPAAETAVSTTAPAPPGTTSLPNKNLLIGAGALALIVVVVLVILNLGGGNSNFGGDEGLLTKIEALVSGTDPQTELFFDQGLPGWEATSAQAFFEDGIVELGEQSMLVRDRTFGPGQGILLDFEFAQIDNDDPTVTFSLQNAPNRADATRIVELRVLAQPESSAIENGEATAADRFARNTTLEVGTSYTAVMGLDASGRFLASVFGFSSNTEEDANFVHVEPEAWANDTWYFHLETGNQGSVTLLGGWEFNFETVK